MGEAEEFWDQRYGERERIWSGRPNAALVDTVGALTPGRALDLGCGEGADSIWLAEQGWTVTGVDVSATALERARAEARARGLAIDWVAADLAAWTPPGEYDLVSACFLHSPISFPRTDVLRRVAGAIAPSGRLLVVGHAEPPPWSRYAEHDHAQKGGHRFLGPEDELAELGLGREWDPELVELRERAATGPDGQEAVLNDSVVLVRRTGG